MNPLRLYDSATWRGQAMGGVCCFLLDCPFGIINALPFSFTELQNLEDRFMPDLIIGYFYHAWEDYVADKNRQWKFINRTLTDAEITEYRAWFENANNGLDGVITDILGAGYKLSLSWIDNQNAFVASISGSERTAHNPFRTVTAWSDEYSDAIGMAAYKHLILANGGDWDTIHNTSQRLG